ncbi:MULTISPECIES: hypothetical protein [Lactobacillus]|uniref:hypothetical protein n=1 Tax=Lactobacillus TaxID=1578 RepID=UPI00050D2958|nr:MULTISPECIES: hypothetical protein [Lactobacillus]AIS09935.1 hypothetical protein LACWKB8_1681 [Lactobacillus sp. wkB8]MCT6888778.1 hypothetical protein [Lactobacillus sp.]
MTKEGKEDKQKGLLHYLMIYLCSSYANIVHLKARRLPNQPDQVLCHKQSNFIFLVMMHLGLEKGLNIT